MATATTSDLHAGDQRFRREGRPRPWGLQRLPDADRGGAAARRPAAERDAALPLHGLPHAGGAGGHALHPPLPGRSGLPLYPGAWRRPLLPIFMRAINDFAAKGGHVLGVCNGFQMLTEAGLLPGALLRNATLRFLSMDCHMRVERADTPYTHRFRRGQVFRSTMAHGDGNYFADDATLDRLEGEGLVALRYCTPEGEVTEAANRNGSARSIAGILSPDLRILGLMPHPENQVDPTIDGTDGLLLFESLA